MWNAMESGERTRIRISFCGEILIRSAFSGMEKWFLSLSYTERFFSVFPPGNSLRRLDGSSLLLALCNLSNGSRNEDKTSAPGLQNASIPSSSSSSGQRCTCLKMLSPLSLEAPLKAKRCSVFSSLQPQ